MVTAKARMQVLLGVVNDDEDDDDDNDDDGDGDD